MRWGRSCRVRSRKQWSVNGKLCCGLGGSEVVLKESVSRSCITIDHSARETYVDAESNTVGSRGSSSWRFLDTRRGISRRLEKR